MLLELVLPWPPTANTYWRRHQNRYFISTRGQLYRKDVALIARDYRDHFSNECKLDIAIQAFPPDKRKRDLDNLLKALLDSLQHANVYLDDSQIESIFIERMPERLGKLHVTLSLHNDKAGYVR